MLERYGYCVLLISLSCTKGQAEDITATDSEQFKLEAIGVIGSREEALKIPGSAHKIEQAELEKFNYSDIHRVLAAVPGVYIREEDGYGLRPNIGMRGSGSERSKKIALMEDGILIAPAPYAAPAAYYFPLMAHMEAVEVSKGPVAIQYGPNTIGGAINLVTQAIPEKRTHLLDATLGGDNLFKLRAFTGDSQPLHGWLVDAVKYRADGFKQLDNGGESGFDKNDLLVKMRFNNDLSSVRYQQWDLKFGYGDEVSYETYLGLSDDDFAATPYRRYAASQKDVMQWDHQQMDLTHYVDFGNDFQLTTQLYHHQFYRSWRKFDGFGDGSPSIRTLLSDPDALYYPLLTGQEDSSEGQADEKLVLVDNQREFFSQGLQWRLDWQTEYGNSLHEVNAGVRWHRDQVERFHTADHFLMKSSQLIATGETTTTLKEETGQATALAVHVQDRISLDALTLTAGLRLEQIGSSLGSTIESLTARHSTWIPGVGVFYQLTPHWGLLAGINKGFVPVSPGQSSEIKPEESWNSEWGARFAKDKTHLEVIGFFNDYSNLKASCTASQGCSSHDVGRDFNGNAAEVYGLESKFSHSWSLQQGWTVPASLTYTWTQASFNSTFDSDNVIWGHVDAGDEIPYVPNHQSRFSVGLEDHGWQTNLSLKMLSAMRDAPGQGALAEGEGTDSQWVIDMAAAIDWQEVQWSLRIDNLLDRAYIVSRRPFGARSGKPRSVMLGIKTQW
jgi:Fe(3+) dicitrate transport protein